MTLSDAETGPDSHVRASRSTPADSMAELLTAAEPTAPRRMGELIHRLEASGRLRNTISFAHAVPGAVKISRVIVLLPDTGPGKGATMTV